MMIGYVVVGIATLYMIYVSTRSRKRMEGGLCIRCGQAPGVIQVKGGPDHGLMCEQCASKTERNHHAAFYFLLGLGILQCMLFGAGLLGDIHKGRTVSRSDIYFFGKIAALPFLLAVAIRIKTRKESTKEEHR